MNPLQELLDWIGEIINETTVGIWAVFFNYAGIALDSGYFTAPITGLHIRMQHLVYISYALVIAIGGVIIMTHETLQTQYAIRHILPHLIVGIVVVSFSFMIIVETLSINKDIVAALLTMRDNIDHFTWRPAPPDDLAHGVALVLSQHVRGDYGATLTSITLLVLMLVATIVLFVSAIMRDLISIGLMIIAPACLACHALPQTDGAARWWWRMWAACHASSIGQAAVLYFWSYAAFTFNGHPRPGEGTINADGLELNVIYLLVTIWAMWKVHAMAFTWARGRPVRFPGSRVAMAVGGMVAWRGINRVTRRRTRQAPRPVPTSAPASAPASAPGRGSAGPRPRVRAGQLPPSRPGVVPGASRPTTPGQVPTLPPHPASPTAPTTPAPGSSGKGLQPQTPALNPNATPKPPPPAAKRGKPPAVKPVTPSRRPRPTVVAPPRKPPATPGSAGPAPRSSAPPPKPGPTSTSPRRKGGMS